MMKMQAMVWLLFGDDYYDDDDFVKFETSVCGGVEFFSSPSNLLANYE